MQQSAAADPEPLEITFQPWYTVATIRYEIDSLECVKVDYEPSGNYHESSCIANDTYHTRRLDELHSIMIYKTLSTPNVQPLLRLPDQNIPVLYSPINAAKGHEGKQKMNLKRRYYV